MIANLPEFEALVSIGCDIAFAKIPEMRRNLQATEHQIHLNITVMLTAAIDCFARAVPLTEHPELMQTLVDGIAKMEQTLAFHEAQYEAWNLAISTIEAAKH